MIINFISKNDSTKNDVITSLRATVDHEGYVETVNVPVIPSVRDGYSLKRFAYGVLHFMAIHMTLGYLRNNVSSTHLPDKEDLESISESCNYFAEKYLYAFSNSDLLNIPAGTTKYFSGADVLLAIQEYLVQSIQNGNECPTQKQFDIITLDFLLNRW